MSTIICLGNRYARSDASGPEVHDRLLSRRLDGVRVIDGGLGGLNLLGFLDGARRVVFVDSVCGYGRPGDVVVIDPAEIADASDGRYDHAAGLPYLLYAAQRLFDAAMPEIMVVGIEGEATAAMLEQAADLAVTLLTTSDARDHGGRDV